MIPKLEEYKARHHIKSENVIKPGLERMKMALQKAGNPEQNLRIIHVAGTNGKGSTIAFMEAILHEHGYTTGVFSSPALIDIHDQIRLNGKKITPQQLDTVFQTMKESGLSGLLTDFELLTAAAFIAFQIELPDFVLLETGMGGLLDSTNVVIPAVSVITSIGLDHTAMLGGTIGEIAEQKAGILKNRVPAVVGSLPEEALEVIRKRAKQTNSKLYIYPKDFRMEKAENGTEIFEGVQKYTHVNRLMKGQHQAFNAALAIEALLLAGCILNETSVQKAVASVQLPFRFQKIAHDVYVDGCHNPAAAKALRLTVEAEFPGEKVDFIVAMLKTKDIKNTLKELQPVAKSFIFPAFTHPEAADPELLASLCDHNTKKVIDNLDDYILLNKQKSEKSIVTGSLYFIMGISNQIKEKRSILTSQLEV